MNNPMVSKMMNLDKNNIEQLISQLNTIITYADKLEKRFQEEISLVHPAHKKSAENILHYIALRHKDIRQLQNDLGKLGVSRLAKAEGHVMTSILLVKKMLQYIIGNENGFADNKYVSFDEGMEILNKNSESLLGNTTDSRRVRIMVTLPSEAAADYELVLKLLKTGMNVARINCAHDDKVIWKKIINNVQKAEKETGLRCRISMDLCGPKLRTGMMTPGPEIIHLQPERDLYGKISNAALVQLVPLTHQIANNKLQIVKLEEDFLKSLRAGDKILFNDLKGKNASFKILEKNDSGYVAACKDNVYLINGTRLTIASNKKLKNHATVIESIPPAELYITLKTGDELILHSDKKPGESAKYDADGKLVEAAHISCTLPEIFPDLRAGEPILFDDGKIEGIIKSVSVEEVVVKITYAKEDGTKLRADKGINLPKSNLRVQGLTNKDKEDLGFIVKHADAVNMSFVNSTDDIDDILKEFKKLKAENLGLIVKIETQRGFENLPGIILSAMRNHPLGIMIARGDLAVECGWKHLAEIQEEILMLCEAAHIPNIWATQVLETLAKKGRPSRAEITDAAMSQRAECVMLNKGAHILDAIKMLDEILTSMQGYQRKKSPVLPVLKVPTTFEV